MKNYAPAHNRHTEINITSLIDVIFMLVVFFMIGAKFDKPAIALTLPKASSGALQERVFVTVSIDADGNIYVDGQETALDALAARFAGYGGGSGGGAGGGSGGLGNVTAALECDGGVPFDRVVAVMDVIKNAGVRNVAIRHDK
jgi:biopolymer transport protein ExbD